MGNGRIARVHRRWATPHELLRELGGWQGHPRPGLTAGQLQAEAALAMQTAKPALSRRIGSQIA